MFRTRRLNASKEEVARLYSEGRLSEAAIEAEAALRSFGDSGELCLMLARCLRKSDPQRAIVAAERAVELDPENALLLLDVAWEVIMLDRYRSRQVLEAVQSLDPQEEPARGLLAYLQGRHAVLERDARQAELYFRKAVQSRPTSDVFAEALIELLAAQGRANEAREISRSALITATDQDLLEAQRTRLGLNEEA